MGSAIEKTELQEMKCDGGDRDKIFSKYDLSSFDLFEMNKRNRASKAEDRQRYM